MDDGHCGLPVEELVPLAAELLEVPGELVRAALDLELADGTVVAATVVGTPLPVPWPACTVLSESSPRADVCGSRKVGKLPWPDIDVPARRCPGSSRSTGLSLAASQADAIRLALTSKVIGRHRRAGRGQDDPHQRHPAHSGRQGCEHVAVRTDGPGRQAAERGHRVGGQNDTPACSKADPRGRRVQSATATTRWLATC